MSNSERLSQMQKENGGGKALTQSSQYMDHNIKIILKEIEEEFHQNTEFKDLKFIRENEILLKDIVIKLEKLYPQENWFYNFKNSSMKPDGGIFYLLDKQNRKYPILIVEMKKQGTNNKKIEQNGKKQARGNAIERLGKNVIGFRKWLEDENIFPFICFGWGCDFEDDSSILDRVITIAEFGKLNETHLDRTPHTNRGSYYFREKPFTFVEMKKIMKDICEKAIYYYFSKYGKDNFIN